MLLAAALCGDPTFAQSVLEDSEGRVWIGTYGTGELGDDWILAICQTARAVYFGSFGGGVSALSKSGTWRRIGIPDGLRSLDVSAIAWRGPCVFFGTLGAGVSVYDEETDGP